MKKKVLRREHIWYCGQVQTGFGHVVLTSLHGFPPNFTHALKIGLGRFLRPFRSARLIEGLFPPLPISLADRNGLKIFSAWLKFGGNPCRDVETA